MVRSSTGLSRQVLGTGALAALLLALLGVLVVAPSPAGACSCVPRTLAQYAHRADSIGLGEVAWVAEGAKQTTTAVDFEHVYKGELGAREKVVTGTIGDSCGLQMDPTGESGQRYLFFLDGTHRGRISATLCGGTTVATPALERRIRQLTGPPGQPVPVDTAQIREPHPPWWWAGVGGGALLLAAGAVWWSLRSGTRRS